jgi:hypothetical protein
MLRLNFSYSRREHYPLTFISLVLLSSFASWKNFKLSRFTHALLFCPDYVSCVFLHQGRLRFQCVLFTKVFFGSSDEPGEQRLR